MILAEALINRGNCQKMIEILREKLVKYARIQEGEKPAEDPGEILDKLTGHFAELTSLMQRINKTNSLTAFDESRSIADVLAHRDVLKQKWNALSRTISAATDLTERYSKKEIKMLSSIDVKEYQKIADDTAKEYREIDLKIQEMNWKVELV